jgi:hypothetical protein
MQRRRVTRVQRPEARAGGLFFQNILRDFVQDLREGYRQAFSDGFSNMFMVGECE